MYILFDHIDLICFASFGFGCQDRWAESSSSAAKTAVALSRARSNLGGVSLLGPKALQCIDGISLRREFMLPLADTSENSLLGACAVLHGSKSIEALCKWRLENVYSSCAWFTFWNQRSVINTEPMGSSISESVLVAVINSSISRQAKPPAFHHAAVLQ